MAQQPPSEITLGIESATTPDQYHLKSVQLKEDIRIVGPVVLVVDGDFDRGEHTVEIAPTGSLTPYAGANVTVSGNGGINNTNTPPNLIVYGTHLEKGEDEAPDYSVTLNGNGLVSGAVYIPDAEYISNGGGQGGSTSGPVVALDVTFKGTPGAFHYDEALNDHEPPFGNYRMRLYSLFSQSEQDPSTAMASVVDDAGYETLFAQLFDEANP